MNRSMVQTLVALSLAGCCFGGHPPGATGTEPPPPPGTGVAPVVGGTPATLAPGFAPDPTVVTGMAGGPMMASTFSPECRGYVPAAPQHTITLTAPFATLRFSVHSDPTDTTIVVRSPTGQVFCNDDTNGLNPEIVNSFPAGPVQIFVGNYSSSAPPAPYTMDISQTAGAFGAPPIGAPPVLGAVGPTGIPLDCGMTRPFYGPIMVGTSIVVGGHTPWSGPDGAGGFVQDDTNWAPEMGNYVGQRTIITSLENMDSAGCPVVRIAADNGQFFWRIRNMSL